MTTYFAQAAAESAVSQAQGIFPTPAFPGVFPGLNHHPSKTCEACFYVTLNLLNGP